MYRPSKLPEVGNRFLHLALHKFHGEAATALLVKEIVDLWHTNYIMIQPQT
jgi:hypothetical protein